MKNSFSFEFGYYIIVFIFYELGNSIVQIRIIISIYTSLTIIDFFYIIFVFKNSVLYYKKDSINKNYR